jgi:hypothetical protein
MAVSVEENPVRNFGLSPTDGMTGSSRMSGGACGSLFENTAGAWKMSEGERGSLSEGTAGHIRKSSGPIGSSSVVDADPFAEFERVVRTGNVGEERYGNYIF